MDSRVENILANMSLVDKAKFVTGADFWRLHSIEELGVPVTMVSDGPHGLRKQSSKEAGINESIKAICFPNAVNLASSFDRKLLRYLGETLGDECQANDVSILLGPGINIKRSPLCGRNFEYYSEDPLVAGELASEYIIGVQSRNVGTSIKHFAVNNQETRRNTISAVIDERCFREIYLRGFEIAIKKAKPWTVMCSYNRINGVYSSENEYLLNQILRNEWGFDGYVVSDWGAANNRLQGLVAGLDLEMPSSGDCNIKSITEAVENGSLPMATLDLSVGRIVEKVLQYSDHRDSKAVFDREKDHAIAKEIALDTIVLLKNDDILPLRSNQKIAFIGELAENPIFQGGGSAHINTDTVISAVSAVSGVGEVVYSRGYEVSKSNNEDGDLLSQAVALAGDVDVAVLFVGLPTTYESEGYDRTHLDLPYNQFKMIKEIQKVQNNIVVVLHNGSPVAMPWIDEVPAVVEAYLGGEAVGEAVVDILFGKHNPCAKLAETFPLSIDDIPCNTYFPGNRSNSEYRESIFVGYRYYEKTEKEVLFPFGHGLSYTEFEYSNLRTNKQSLLLGDELSVTFDITNVGQLDGKEIAQVYVAVPNECDVFMPVKQLGGFEKVFAKAGETVTVSVNIDMKAFQYYNTIVKDWVTISGDFMLMVGASSVDIRLNQLINVSGTGVDSPYFQQVLPSYFSGKVNEVAQEEFVRLYGREIKERKIIDGQFDTTNTFEDVQHTKWGRRLIKIIKNFAVRATDDSNGDSAMSVMLSMPFSSLPAMTSGIFEHKTVQSLIRLFNNKKQFVSLCKVLVRAIKLIKIL